MNLVTGFKKSVDFNSFVFHFHFFYNKFNQKSGGKKTSFGLYIAGDWID